MPRLATYRAFLFTVQGDSTFPYDMLRHDRCVPHTDADAFNMDADGLRSVRLIGFSQAGHGMCPDVERWQSFGWTVVAVSIRPIMSVDR